MVLIRRTLGFAFCVILPYLFCPYILVAGEFNLIPTFEATTEYNDNLFFDDEDESAEDEYLVVLSPGIRMEQQSERLFTDIAAEISFLFYQNNDELDTEDQNYQANFRYSITPRLDLNLGALYREDSRRDRDIESSGQLILSNATRYRQNYELGASYRLTEILSTDIEYVFDKDEFDDDFEIDEFADYQSDTVRVRLLRLLDENIDNYYASINIEYDNYDIDDIDGDTQIDSYAGFIGYRRPLNELISLEVNLGGLFYESDFDYAADDGNSSYDDLTPYVQATIEYDGEISNGYLRFSHHLVPYSGRNALTELTAIRLNLNRRLTENLRINLGSGYYINKAKLNETSIEEIDEHTFRIQPFIQYRLNRYLSFVTAYRYTIVDDKTDDTLRKRNLIFARLQFEYPLFD